MIPTGDCRTAIPLETSPSSSKSIEQNIISYAGLPEYRTKWMDERMYLPIPTRVPTVISGNSICHSSKGNNGLFRNGEDCNALFQVDIRSSAVSSLRSEPMLPNRWGDEGNDNAFWVLICLLEPSWTFASFTNTSSPLKSPTDSYILQGINCNMLTTELK